MKVLIFTSQFYQLGGAERLAVELAESLNKMGIHTDILSMYKENEPDVTVVKQILLNKGIPNIHFLGMKIHPNLLEFILGILKLKLLVRKNKYTIIETSQVTPSIIASWAIRNKNARLISGLHQIFRKDRENRIVHKFFRFSVKSNPHIRFYAISDCAVEKWIEFSKTPYKNIRRIYNAIHNDYFSQKPDRDHVRKEFDIPLDSKLALYVGRLAAYKGIDTILEALSPILEKENIYLFYIGLPDDSICGTKEMVQNIKKTISISQWGYRVKFIGYRTDIPRLMASSDILVHPTRIEGFGLVLAEALATGLPIVASNVEGIPEVLSGTDSLMVNPNDSIALRDAILKILHRNNIEAEIARQKGYRKAMNYKVEKRTMAMLELFDDVLNNRF